MFTLNHNNSAQVPSTTVWLQQDHAQPTIVLPQGGVVQQTLDNTFWNMQQQVSTDMGSAQLQMQAPQASTSSSSTDVSKFSAVLQDILVSLQPAVSQSASTGISSSMPIVLQLQGTSSGQGMQQMPVINLTGQTLPQQQQVFTTASGEQVVFVTGSPGSMRQVQAQVCAGASASGEVQVLLQQLQNALQRVPGETAAAALQQVVLSMQASQPQASQPSNGLMPEGTVMTSTYVGNQQSGLPAHFAGGSPDAGTFTPQCSPIVGSWQSIDNLCNSGTGSPAYAMHTSASAPGTVSAGPTSMLRVVSGPGMPYPNVGTGGNMPIAAESATMQLQRVGSAGIQNQLQTGSDPNYMLLGCLGHDQAGPPGRQQPGMLPRSRHQPFRGNTPFSAEKPRPPAPKAQAGIGARAGSAQGAAPGAQDSISAHLGAAALVAAEGAAATGSASTGPGFSGPAASLSLQQGMQQLWTGQQLRASVGGSLFNTEQRMAWQPVGEPEPGAQDLYDFQKLKHVMQKLDAVHRTRVKLIKRLHAVADYGGCDMKSVYFEVRCMIGEMVHSAAAQGRPLEDCRVTGLVRLAAVLQDALTLGPAEPAGAEGAAVPEETV